jgi:hypothetical protein
MTNELSGPTGTARAIEARGHPDRSSVAITPAPVGTLAEVVDEEGGTNGQRTLGVPGSRGTGPVDPAYDFVDNERG